MKTNITVLEYVDNWKALLKQSIALSKRVPSLFIIQVGSNEASTRYVRNKIKDCESIGIEAELLNLPESITTESICNYIDAAVDADFDGIIVQLPLPEHIDKDQIIRHIPKDRDVDGFRNDSVFTPCTPLGIINYLDYIGFQFAGKHAVILGRSDIVGKPMAKLLQTYNCTTSLCNSKTPKELRDKLLSMSDLVICAVGQRNFISSQDALNAFIVDVGINFDDNGKLCGDVDVSVVDKDRVTPVPGGVGRLTRMALVHNVVESALMKK